MKIRPATASRIAGSRSVPSRAFMTYPSAPVAMQVAIKSGFGTTVKSTIRRTSCFTQSLGSLDTIENRHADICNDHVRL